MVWLHNLRKYAQLFLDRCLIPFPILAIVCDLISGNCFARICSFIYKPHLPECSAMSDERSRPTYKFKYKVKYCCGECQRLFYDNSTKRASTQYENPYKYAYVKKSSQLPKDTNLMSWDVPSSIGSGTSNLKDEVGNS